MGEAHSFQERFKYSAQLIGYYAQAEIPGSGREAVPQGIHMHEMWGEDARGPHQGQGREDQVQEVQEQEVKAHKEGAENLVWFFKIFYMIAVRL
jgi:hypothetical protein